MSNMCKGTYIGDDPRFQHRSALVFMRGDTLMAQFDEGELWETHDWIKFDKKDWFIS